MSRAPARYINTRSVTSRLFEKASEAKASSSRKTDFDAIFNTDVRGFREILLVVIVARLMDENYTPGSDLYSCSPRAMYEGPIREVLTDLSIPHGKSGPLNIAKAAEGLNAAWAAQRRPQNAADAVVRIVEQLEQSSAQEVENIGIELCRRLLAEAKRVEALSIDLPEEANPLILAERCHRLITEAPDAGNTPQRIAGLLLQAVCDDSGSDWVLAGHLDRASTTSTTSKKAGDIAETSVDGRMLHVYEVTVKPFDAARLRDAAESVRMFAESRRIEIGEVIVLCRDADIPVEAKRSKFPPVLATHEARGITFVFVDIFAWITAQLLRLSWEGRKAFYMSLDEYVSDPSTAEKVKSTWRSLHEQGA